MIAHAWHMNIGSVFRAWFDDRPLEAIANELEAIDIEWIEVWDCHCSPEKHDPGMFHCTLGEQGVSIAGYGIVDLDDTGVARNMPCALIGSVWPILRFNYPPTREDINPRIGRGVRHRDPQLLVGPPC